jgi:photosystem II stability/assembly factor-like uncharacterized protein
VVDGNNLLAGTSEGISRSSDNGATWTSSDSGLNDTSITSLVKSGNKLYASTVYSGLFFSTNRGTNWTAINDSSLGQSSKNINSFAVTGDTIFMGIPFTMVVSTNGGSTWTETDIDLCEVHAIGIEGGSILASLDMIEILSTHPSYEVKVENQGGRYFSKPTGNQNIVETRGNGIFRSTNNGLNWEWVSDLFVTSFAISGGVIYAACLNGGTAVSTDNGLTWSSPDTGFMSLNVNSIVAENDNLFAGTSDGIFLSHDGGTSWEDVSTGLTNMDITSLAISNSYICAGTGGNGIWRRPLSEMITGVYGKNNRYSRYFYLSQNYPNPFNPSTTISYQLPVVSQVTLKIYDVLGREVTTLVDEKKAPGTYDVKFDGSRLASGVYFCRMAAGNYASTKKLLMIK